MRDARCRRARTEPLRKAMLPFVGHLVTDPDDMIWLMATN